ncbi:MAG: hypothetical protein KGL53_04585, partial [Elusimicrobia bacterium]|nr:hypothetical protein [Elusimicrobiota bacterium]
APRGRLLPLSLALLACAAGLSLAEDAALVRRVPTAERALPARTLAWVRDHAPADALFLTNKNKLLYLYTDRRAVTYAVPPDPETLRSWLLSDGIGYVLFIPEELFHPRDQLAWERLQGWVSAAPGWYAPSFADGEEGSSIYRVEPDPRFLEAFRRYQEALRALAAGKAARGLAGLEAALRLEPSLADALNAYGAACLLSGKDLEKARTRLVRATKTRPGFVLAYLNLVRVDRLLGRTAEARAALAGAERALGGLEGSPELAAEVSAERTSLD